jgi:hypothetical protein
MRRTSESSFRILNMASVAAHLRSPSVCMYVCVFVWGHVCICVGIWQWLCCARYLYVCVIMCLWAYIYIYIYIYIHTHTHTTNNMRGTRRLV